MRMKRRIITALLAASLTAASFAGCVQGGEGEERVTQATTTTAAAASGNEIDFSQPPVEITVEVYDRGNPGGSDPANNYWANWIKENALADLNIKVEFVKVDRHTEDEKITLLLAAGDAPDLCMSYNNNQQIEEYYSKGGIHDLAPYLESMDAELTDLKEFLGEFLLTRNKDPKTGEIHSINMRRVQTARSLAWIRKDWLDTLGLPLPTTTEQYVDALRAFRDQDPGGVGKDKVIPLTMTPDVRWRANLILESFIPPNLTDKERYMYSVVGEIGPLFPGVKEGAQLLNQMYLEGLIDRDFALYSDDEMSDNVTKAGLVGSYIHNWDQPMRATPGIITELQKSVPGAEFVPISCFTNPADGKIYNHVIGSHALYMFIPKTCENPEAVLRYLNWMAKPEIRIFLQEGIEGENFEYDENGLWKRLDATGEYIMNSLDNIDYTPVINGLDLGDPVKTGAAMAGAYAGIDAETVGTALAYATINGWELPHVPWAGSVESERGVSATIKEKRKELYIKAVTAPEGGFESAWEEGMKAFLGSGAQASMEEREKRYDGELN